MADEAAESLAGSLKRDISDYVTGPAAPVINRIRSLYLMEILLKLPKDTMLQNYKKVILNNFNLLHAEKKFRSVQLIADVDAM